MLAFLRLIAMFVADLFKSPRRLEAENLFLRHQLNIALRRRPSRLPLRGSDRALLVWMTRLWPSLLGMAQVVEPATILRWHRAGFRSYWRWKSRKRVGRPRIDHELRDLIRRINRENPLWGAPRIHGELLKLGFELAESRRQAADRPGVAGADPANKPREPCVYRKLRFGRIGGAVHRRGHETQCVRSAGSVGLSGHPCSRTDVLASHCSSVRMSAEPGASAAHPAPQLDRRIRDGWSQSAFRRNNSAMAIPPKSACRGCPWLVIAA